MFAELFVTLGRRVAGTSGSEREGAAGSARRLPSCSAEHLCFTPTGLRGHFSEDGFFFQHKQIQGQRHEQLSLKGFKVCGITVRCRLLSFPASRPTPPASDLFKAPPSAFPSRSRTWGPWGV